MDISDIGNEVLVSVNADGKAGFELLVATLNTVDVVTKGQDVIVRTLSPLLPSEAAALGRAARRLEGAR